MLVGNKLHKEHARTVSTTEGQKIAGTQWDMRYREEQTL